MWSQFDEPLSVKDQKATSSGDNPPDRFAELLESFTKALNAFKTSLDKHVEAIREHEQADARKAEPHPEQVIRSVVRLPPAIEGYYNSEQRERARKNKWERIKRTLEVGGVLVAVILAALTYGTLREVASQARSAQQQVSIMQGQLEEADRPWIKVTAAVPRTDLTFSSESHVDITISVETKNIGRSVALNVSVRGRMSLTDDPEGLSQEQSRVCSGAAENMAPSPVLSSIFPEDSSGNSFLIMGAQDLPPKIEAPLVPWGTTPLLAPRNSKLISATFLGCVSYRYPTSPKPHYSGFRFALEFSEVIPKGKKLDPATMLFHNQPHTVRYLVVGNNIPMADLSLEKFFSGFDAN